MCLCFSLLLILYYKLVVEDSQIVELLPDWVPCQFFVIYVYNCTNDWRIKVIMMMMMKGPL